MIDPIRRSVVVTCSPTKAFEVFTAKMDGWWPIRVHSRAADRGDGSVKAERVVLEPWVGGRLFEVMSDGSEGSWGTILTWDPPHRLVIAWKPNSSPHPQRKSTCRSSNRTTDRRGSPSNIEDGSDSATSPARAARRTPRAGRVPSTCSSVQAANEEAG